MSSSTSNSSPSLPNQRHATPTFDASSTRTMNSNCYWNTSNVNNLFSMQNQQANAANSQHNKPYHITRAVQAISNLHHTCSKSTRLASIRATVCSPRYFPRVFSVVMFWSGIVRYIYKDVQYKQRLQESRQIYYQAYHGCNSCNNQMNGSSLGQHDVVNEETKHW